MSKNYAAMNDGAKVIAVIETTLTRRGDGKDTVLRIVKQYWSLEGELLAECDPVVGDDRVAYRDFHEPGTGSSSAPADERFR